MGLKMNAAFTEEIRDGVGALKKQNEPFPLTRRASESPEQATVCQKVAALLHPET